MPSDSSIAPARADRAARMAGMLLLATAAVTVVMAAMRVLGDPDQPTLFESLQAIGDNRVIYGVGGAARFVSGVTLLAAGWYLSRTWIIRNRLVAPLVAYLLIASGAITAVSGVCAILIALLPTPEATWVDGVLASDIPTLVEAISYLRWLTGKIGFAAAGIALLIAARSQWRARGTLRTTAPALAVTGVAMQFIWIDSATIVHPIVGAAFFLWLVAVGTMLATGRVERHFIAAYGSPELRGQPAGP